MEPEKPQIALARIDGLLNRVFAIGVLILTFDVAQNAFRQIDYLNPFWFWGTFSALIVSIGGLVFSTFFSGKSSYWFRAVVLVTLFTLLTWGFQMRNDVALPTDYKPWIWWALGYALVAAVGAWAKEWVYVSLIFGPAIWILVVTTPSGGSASLFTAIQDSLYTFFFSLAISLLVLELKDRAIKLDSENDLVLQSSLERVRLEAIRIERAHINSMLIDKSISTLNVAANALTSKQKSMAVEMARDAISHLEAEMSRGATPPDSFGSKAILTPLVNAIYNRSPDWQVTVKGETELQLSYHLATGIYEATILALNNSLAHAPDATVRKVNITLRNRGLKIVVHDNGGGFRMSSVHKTALGVRWTIFRRLASVGVKAKLDTSLGKGTTWIFEWYP